MVFRETQDHIMYNMCAKFHQNPCINFGGVGGTNLCLRTDRLIPVYSPNFVAGGIIENCSWTIDTDYEEQVT
jgi:hypothetical protein